MSRYGILLVLLLAGCGGGEPTIPLDMPTTWQTDRDGRWWLAGTDTSLAFRPLDSLADMGLSSSSLIYDGTRPPSAQPEITDERLAWSVKENMMPLFRNRPDVVDSLFEKYVRPKITASGAPEEAIERYKRESYRTLSRHFREPRVLTVLGRDLPVVIPDSLTETAAGRAVPMQIYLDEEGRPLAIAVRRPLHPILDRIAIRTTTQMRWQPAYVLRGGKSQPIPSWTRFQIRFPE